MRVQSERVLQSFAMDSALFWVLGSDKQKNSLVEQAAWDEDFELCFIIIFMVRGRDFSKKYGVYRPFKQVSSASMKCWSQTQYNKKEKRKYFPSSNGIVCWGKFGLETFIMYGPSR